MAANNQRRFICLDCGCEFRPPALPWSRSSKVLVWAIILFFFPFILAFLSVSLDFTEQIETFFDVAWFESLLTAFPGTVFAMLTLQAFLLAVFALIWIPISNSRFRTELMQKGSKLAKKEKCRVETELEENKQGEQTTEAD